MNDTLQDRLMQMRLPAPIRIFLGNSLAASEPRGAFVDSTFALNEIMQGLGMILVVQRIPQTPGDA